MFSFWKPKSLTEPLLQSQFAILVTSKPIFNKLEKLKKRLIDVNSKQMRTKQADKRCRAALYVIPSVTCSGVVALTTLTINKYLQSSLGEVRFNNELSFENKTCAEITFRYKNDELCSLTDSPNLRMVDDYYAIRACFPIFLDMCANENYGWVVLCTIVLALLSIGFFYGNTQWNSYSGDLLSKAENNLLKNFKISKNESVDEKLEHIDEILQTTIEAHLPVPLINLIDEYLTQENEDIFAKVAMEAMRPRLR